MPVIVVSGPPGAGSSTVAEEVAEQLGIDYFSPGKYFKGKIDGSETVAANEGWKSEKLSSENTHNSIDDLQKQIASRGDVVFDGKLSIHMLSDKADLTVWLTAPLKVRAQRTSERDHLSVEEVKELMRERQQEEIKNWKEMYGFNYLDQQDDADIVIDTEDKTPDEIVELILSKL